jgi:hypothetical protein
MIDLNPFPQNQKTRHEGGRSKSIIDLSVAARRVRDRSFRRISGPPPRSLDRYSARRSAAHILAAALSKTLAELRAMEGQDAPLSPLLRATVTRLRVTP